MFSCTLVELNLRIYNPSVAGGNFGKLTLYVFYEDTQLAAATIDEVRLRARARAHDGGLLAYRGPFVHLVCAKPAGLEFLRFAGSLCCAERQPGSGRFIPLPLRVWDE